MAGEPNNDSGAYDTDAVLVESARRGSKDALGHLLSKYRANVVALCRKMLGDVSLIDDAAQETGLLGVDCPNDLYSDHAMRLVGSA